MPEEAPEPIIGKEPAVAESPQAALFSEPMVDKRVIPFDSLTTQAERESIRARVASVERPAPVKTGKVELPRARAAKKQVVDKQGQFDFLSHEEVRSPDPSIICDAPVAPISMRLQAALWDGVAMASGCIFLAASLHYAGGEIPTDKKIAIFYALALATVPLLYKLLWMLAGRDTPGMRRAGLRLVNFDGNPPSRERRYVRTFGSLLSVLAGGMGLLWAFVDEDKLTWQDHMSGTFPTIG
jgi:uncharacterized RDD family membrane protein YckC